MKILHISNDYCGSKVHANLYSELDKQGVQQAIYTYYRDPLLEGKNRFEAQSVDFVYRPILSTYHRMLYHKKIRDVYADLKSQLSQVIPSYDLIHATTLFSDGAVARHAYKEYGIPYVVTVRNTDINAFLGYAPHTWLTGLKVLKDARRIVFISKALKEKFCRHLLVRIFLKKIENRFVIQPNGIDAYWIEHIRTTPMKENHNVIYVGRFDYNKNVMKLCKSILEMHNTYPDIKLHLVGGDGRYEGEVKSIAYNNPETIIYHGKIYDKSILKDIYSRCSVFAMPSYHETFGLVYLEALSQHLAIIYTKGQGVDGMLDEHVGESVRASSKEDIKGAIDKIFMHRGDYLAAEVVDFGQFKWDSIASRYVEVYDDVLKETKNVAYHGCRFLGESSR